MSLLQQIKSAQLSARKARLAADAASLTTLIGEAEAIGKNAGNREVTDLEVVALVKKFIKNNVETTTAVDASTSSDRQERLAILQRERALFETFLPAQLTGDALSDAIDAVITELAAAVPKDMGRVLKTFKDRFEGQYDGAVASALVKAKLNK